MLRDALALLDEAHRLERGAKYKNQDGGMEAALGQAAQLRDQSRAIAAAAHAP